MVKKFIKKNSWGNFLGFCKETPQRGGGLQLSKIKEESGINGRFHNNIQNKKAQLTIFIILALLIVFILIVLYIKWPSRITTATNTPLQQIKECANKQVESVLGKIQSQGGSYNPELYYLYQDTKIQYLCYTEEYYQTCVMQKPLLKQSIEKEIENATKKQIQDCVNTVRDNLVSKGYDVSIGKIEPKIELANEKIIITIASDLSVPKDTTEKYSSVKSDIDSNLYELVMIASSIQNWEARFGTSESLNYMFYYPSIKVEKLERDEGTTIYKLTNRESGEQFVFASKSLPWKVGYT